MNIRGDIAKRSGFAIFRASEAGECAMETLPLSPVAAEGGGAAMAAGAGDGHELKLLFSMPGMSLARAWFKSGFPLPRHSHNVDCLYYIIGGSLRMGTEELGVGDGFFVGGEVPYAYTAGPEGVEVLEFRAADAFNIHILANNPAFWEKALETVRERQPKWVEEQRPSEKA